MNKTEFSRYLYEHRVISAAFAFILIASISCGFYSRNSAGYVCNFGSVFLRTALPLISAAAGGFIVGGSLLVVGGTSVYGFLFGRICGNAFERSFGKGLLYLFFCGIPCNTVYILCFAFTFISAFDCVRSRLYLRRKGLKRPMNNYESRQYFAKTMLSFGILLFQCALEILIFGAAYCKI